MAHKHSTVVEAYAVLGIEQHSSLEVVKSTYKQLALKTHPDKNPGDADATTQFQKLSEAYNVLLKHLDRSSSPPLRQAHSNAYGHSHDHNHTRSHFHPFADYNYDDYDESDDDDYGAYDEYDEYDSDYDDDLSFYMFLFEEAMRNRANRYAYARYHRQQDDQTPSETSEQYSARLRKAREEQEQAAERRAWEETNRKATRERQREQERRQAEERQRLKASAKKAEAEALRKATEQKARAQQQKMQNTRSKVFAAARKGDAPAVRSGVWEDNVDAAGGEVRKGAEALVKPRPADPKETLLHIAAKNGDVDLVEWLDSHSADPEERDGNDKTAFHVALEKRHTAVIRYLFESYPPNDEDYGAIYRSPTSHSNLRIALDTREPEVVWIILDKNLHSGQEMDEAWETLTNRTFKSSVSPPSKFDELVNLFAMYGKGKYDPFSMSSGNESPATPPPTQTPRKNHKHPRQPRPTFGDARSGIASPIPEQGQPPLMPSPFTPGPRPSRGRGNRGKAFQPQSYPSPPTTEQSSTPSPVNEVPQTGLAGGRGRGRGRGQFRSRGRGRGRGRSQAPAGGALPLA